MSGNSTPEAPVAAARAAALDSESLPAQSEAIPEPASHILRRAIVLDRYRLFYVPVPKAGCTALLWSLAGLARVRESEFADSPGREVSRLLTIHDLSRWPEPFRFGELSPDDREHVLGGDDWFRITVVRHPFRRLWSAWQSKILLAEPQFIEKFSSQPWFPGPVRSAAEVLKAFRAFLEALREDPDLVRSDVHWAPQIDLIDYPQVSYDHIGHIEELGRTLNRVREHVSETKDAVLPELPRNNVGALSYSDELFTEADVRFLAEMYADDMRVFGYESPRDEALGNSVPRSWTSRADTLAPALEALRQRHERVADLYQLLWSRRKDLSEMERRRKRERKLRREEHRRNQRLQKRLVEATEQLHRMRNSTTWRYTAPLRRAGARLRRLRRALSRGRQSG
ncbi:MAG: sulfotransferase family 2 domain-containing protein [Actinomycetota bacterium]